MLRSHIGRRWLLAFALLVTLAPTLLLAGEARAAGAVVAQEQTALVNDQVRWTPEVIFNDGV